jgi:hypothetical protein
VVTVAGETVTGRACQRLAARVQLTKPVQLFVDFCREELARLYA